MKYTVYKITNTINNKIYIGVHKTNNLEDGYMGSGVVLKRAIEKYGVKNFNKEYLHIFDTSEEMFDMEAELVDEVFVENKDTYNLKLGGSGGFDFINSNSLNYNFSYKDGELGRINSTKALKLLYLDKEYIDRCSETISKGMFVFFDNGGKNGFVGKSHTDISKAKIGEANSKHQKGKGNSQYGKMWIYNLDLKESKPIKKSDYPKYEDLGWLQGRKMKF